MLNAKTNTDEIQETLKNQIGKRRQVVAPETVSHDAINNPNNENNESIENKINIQERTRKLEESLHFRSVPEPCNSVKPAEELKQDPEVSQDSSSVPNSPANSEPDTSEEPVLAKNSQIPFGTASAGIMEEEEEKQNKYQQSKFGWFGKSLKLKDELCDDLREYLIPKEIDPVMTKITNHLNKEYNKIKAIRGKNGYGDALAKLLPKLAIFRDLCNALEQTKVAGNIGPFREILENEENMKAMHLPRGCFASVTGKDCDDLKEILKKFYGNTYDAVNAENRQQLRH